MVEFIVDAVCADCRGTGLFSGMAEGKGGAVVCHTCKGTGCQHIKLNYEPFVERKKAEGIEWVYPVNPGIMAGKGDGFNWEDFGGQSVEDWEAGKPWPKGFEMRKYTCPAWYYQCFDFELRPDWKPCRSMWGRSFSLCEQFGCKAECWTRWDEEHKR